MFNRDLAADRKLCEEADKYEWSFRDFARKFQPKVILTYIEEIERLRAENTRLIEGVLVTDPLEYRNPPLE